MKNKSSKLTWKMLCNGKLGERSEFESSNAGQNMVDGSEMFVPVFFPTAIKLSFSSIENLNFLLMRYARFRLNSIVFYYRIYQRVLTSNGSQSFPQKQYT